MLIKTAEENPLQLFPINFHYPSVVFFSDKTFDVTDCWQR